MKFPESTRFAKGNTILTCAAFVVYVYGFATPYWLHKSFLFPLNRGGQVDLPVDARIGLFAACKIETYLNGKSYESCSSEGAADWQIISAALAIAGLVLAVAGLLFSVLNVCTQRLATRTWVKWAIFVCNFLACGFSVGPVIIFSMNRKIQVQPKFSSFQVDFDLDYSYIIAAVGAALFGVLALLNILDIVGSSRKEKNEELAAFVKLRNSVN